MDEEEDDNVLEEEAVEFGVGQEFNKSVDLERKQPGALYALVVLTALSLLNYLDRYVPSATKALFQVRVLNEPTCRNNSFSFSQEELELDDTQTGAPFTAFVIMYLVRRTQPPSDTLTNRSQRHSQEVYQRTAHAHISLTHCMHTHMHTHIK